MLHAVYARYDSQTAYNGMLYMISKLKARFRRRRTFHVPNRM